MLSTTKESKEIKNAAKQQKKLAKSNKKQQQKDMNLKKNAQNTSTKAAEAGASLGNNNNNNINTENNNHKLKDAALTSPISSSQTTPGVPVQYTPTNHHVLINTITPATTTPTMNNDHTAFFENPPKFERSSSFSLKHKLSKLFKSPFTDSKENLSKGTMGNGAEVPGNGGSGPDGFELPYKFTRSRSMILPRRTNRRSLIEPQLEQLSEESERSADGVGGSGGNGLVGEDATVTLRKSSSPWGNGSVNDLSYTASRNRSFQELKTPRRHSTQPFSSTPVEEAAATPSQDSNIKRKVSAASLSSAGSTAASADTNSIPSQNPQLNFQRRRSNTLIASFKSTFGSFKSINSTGSGGSSTTTGTSGSGSDKKKHKLNPKWRDSLQSLQAIDNIVSYEDMSFIDYDKFNGYEKQLERQLSTLSLMDTAAVSNVSHGANGAPLTPTTAIHPTTPTTIHGLMEADDSGAACSTTTVIRRRRPSRQSSNHSLHHSSMSHITASTPKLHDSSSFNFDTDYDHNLDKIRNVYRDSLDSRKLELLNALNRNSYTSMDKYILDVLHLESPVSRPQLRRAYARDNARRVSPTDVRGIDTVDNAGKGVQLKSKSLTHLDGWMVSSSEYFSVSFYTSQGQEEEFIPATKGVTLSTALSHALKRRNLSFSQIQITDNNQLIPGTLSAESSPLVCSFDENTEVEHLAGRHLIITERDGSRKLLQKAASFGSHPRPPRLLSSASTEETTSLAVLPSDIHHLHSISAVAKQQTTKPRWSGLFTMKNPQHPQLCELLNGYARNGVPQRPRHWNFDHPQMEAALAYLDAMHASWKDFVYSVDLCDTEIRIQTAIWELVQTEVYYIHALQTVTDLFLACLEAVQDDGLLTDVDAVRLFSNIRDICEANLKFWTYYLYPMVAHSLATREPLNYEFFQQGFYNFGLIFAPYKKYCAEQSSCQFYCKELYRQNALFTSYLAWCEGQKLCNRLRLADILVRPMQRLTKYTLLLEAIKRNLNDQEEVEAYEAMIHSVDNFVFSVNNHLTTRQENERLKGVMARLESYEVVDSNNETLDKIIKQHSQVIDLCAPMKGVNNQHTRHLFMEGDHKFKDSQSKTDVHCFLLTDMLLICKYVAKKGAGSLKIIRQPYLTDRLVVEQVNNVLHCAYLNEFQLAVAAFTLQCAEAKNWYESLKRAKAIYLRLKEGSMPLDMMRYGSTSSGGGGPSGPGGSAGIAIGGTGGIGLAHNLAAAGTSGALDSLGVKKSPLNSSIGSHVSSSNNSRSGSTEWNDSRNVSVDFEKTHEVGSMSSDEGAHGGLSLSPKLKGPPSSPLLYATQSKLKPLVSSSSNTLSVEPLNHLGQSLPNLTTTSHHSHSNNTLLVPGTTTSHSGNLLLSTSHRGISYPPPSPTRVPLRRGMAFSTSTKNPPLVKTRNISSQSSINWVQIPATPSPSPQSPSPHGSPGNQQQQQQQHAAKPLTKSSAHELITLDNPELRRSTETDV